MSASTVQYVDEKEKLNSVASSQSRAVKNVVVLRRRITSLLEWVLCPQKNLGWGVLEEQPTQL